MSNKVAMGNNRASDMPVLLALLYFSKGFDNTQINTTLKLIPGENVQNLYICTSMIFLKAESSVISEMRLKIS